MVILFVLFFYLRLLFLAVERNVLRRGEDEHVQRRQVGARRAVGVGAVLAQQPHAVQVKHLRRTDPDVN